MNLEAVNIQDTNSAVHLCRTQPVINLLQQPVEQNCVQSFGNRISIEEQKTYRYTEGNLFHYCSKQRTLFVNGNFRKKCNLDIKNFKNLKKALKVILLFIHITFFQTIFFNSHFIFFYYSFLISVLFKFLFFFFGNEFFKFHSFKFSFPDHILFPYDLFMWVLGCGGWPVEGARVLPY